MLPACELGTEEVKSLLMSLEGHLTFVCAAGWDIYVAKNHLLKI